jgi:putative aminopeptidase FrvX
MKAKKRQKRRRGAETSPAIMLADELAALRRDLRATIRAYAARLEIDLAESMAMIVSSKGAETLSRERLHEIRDLTIMVRKRKLKPEKGRRKDLRKIDSLIRDLHSVTHPGAARGRF